MVFQQELLHMYVLRLSINPKVERHFYPALAINKEAKHVKDETNKRGGDGCVEVEEKRREGGRHLCYFS